MGRGTALCARLSPLSPTTRPPHFLPRPHRHKRPRATTATTASDVSAALMAHTPAKGPLVVLFATVPAYGCKRLQP